MSKGNSGMFHGTRGNPQMKLPLGVGVARLPASRSQLDHIFRDARGHLSDTAANRSRLLSVANDHASFLGTDRYGTSWFARTEPDGTQLWVSVRNGVVQNGGQNQRKRKWSPVTGLNSSSHRKGKGNG
ncbi:hypothetical protein QJ043_07065 [Olsenella sp. YH-ols2217]|uniref:Uncharacterized protein n=1 Tax=Kribbibacterium absianum TaxID=3044210 RepID=A0ABT6ZM15_9ACTN|nr:MULTISPECIES: hypothetical protein [unclassified Olsenella]MDJ1121826.1 hypothetical protein [Olsenella sp. YH-ols2216]MDJ1129834.1 hypothetical protein [Olsenella sp. YH-ols2217]